MVYDGITRRQILELARTKSDPAVSIFVPTFRAGTEVLQGRIKLKNMLTRAEDILAQRGMRRTIAIDLLQPATLLDEDPEFWNDRLDSVALFISQGMFKAFHLPFSAPELLHVGSRFCIRPLIQVLSTCPNFFVLALEKNNVRLVQCGPRGALNVHVANMPHSLDEFSSTDHTEKQLQFHSAGRAGRAGSVIGHGAGDKGADENDRLRRFALAIARAIEVQLASRDEPIVLAGTAEFLADLRATANLSHLLNTSIVGSPKMLDPSKLEASARPIVDRFADSGRNAALAHLAAVSGTGLSSQQIEEILPAALHGRVDVLLTCSDDQVWGRYDDRSGTCEIHTDPLPGDTDLVNEAAVNTLLASGLAYNVRPGELNDGAAVAAVFRY